MDLKKFAFGFAVQRASEREPLARLAWASHAQQQARFYFDRATIKREYGAPLSAQEDFETASLFYRASREIRKIE